MNNMELNKYQIEEGIKKTGKYRQENGSTLSEHQAYIDGWHDAVEFIRILMKPGKFKLTEDQLKQAKNTSGFLDWNTLTLDQMVNYLDDKYKYSNTGDAKCIYHLIEFYRKTKAI